MHIGRNNVGWKEVIYDLCYWPSQVWNPQDRLKDRFEGRLNAEALVKGSEVPV